MPRAKMVTQQTYQAATACVSNPPGLPLPAVPESCSEKASEEPNLSFVSFQQVLQLQATSADFKLRVRIIGVRYVPKNSLILNSGQ